MPKMVSLNWMKKILALLLITFSFLIFAKGGEAKVLPQAGKAGSKTTVRSSGGTTIGVYPKLRSDRKALNVNFSNLQNAKSVSYQLIYKTSAQEEAAMGGLNLKGQNSESAELLFGTCSKNVCRYHSGIRDARLEVSYTSKTGRKYLKKFKIKV